MHRVIDWMYSNTDKRDEDLARYLQKHYEQPHRTYHNLSHLEAMWRYIVKNVPVEHWSQYVDAVFWHDLVYEPGATDNEQRSAEAFAQYARKHPSLLHADPEVTTRLIMSTKDPYAAYTSGDELTVMFTKADWNGMMDMNDIDTDIGISKSWLDQWERGVFLENQKFPIDIYLEKRDEFLDKALEHKLLTGAVHAYAKNKLRRVYRVGVMAGSFSPFHNGHMEIYNQARAMFDKVVIVACRNPDKPERVSDVHDILPYTEIIAYRGQLVDLMYEMNFQQDYKGWAVQPVLVRGIRNDFDRQYEEMYVRTLRDQCRRRHMREFPVVHFLCSPQYSHVSSTLVRGLLPDDRAMYTPAPYTAPKLEINW